MTIRIGCQGWNYPDWVGPFYPPGTKAKDFLATYARVFDVVEIDSTWYATPDAKHVERWSETTPVGFLFCPKLDREITHERRFVECEEPLRRYLETMRVLGRKLGPILIQCEATFGPEELSALQEFLPLLPGDLRFAIEFRHTGWFTEETHRMLSERNIAWALVSARWIPRKWMLQLGERPTADFSYLRWLGPDRSIETFNRQVHDRTEDLELWVGMMETLGTLVRVYALINNHYEGHSPGTARKLQRMLRLPTVDPEDLAPQLDLL